MRDHLPDVARDIRLRTREKQAADRNAAAAVAAANAAAGLKSTPPAPRLTGKAKDEADRAMKRTSDVAGAALLLVIAERDLAQRRAAIGLVAINEWRRRSETLKRTVDLQAEEIRVLSRSLSATFEQRQTDSDVRINQLLTQHKTSVDTEERLREEIRNLQVANATLCVKGTTLRRRPPPARQRYVSV